MFVPYFYMRPNYTIIVTPLGSFRVEMPAYGVVVAIVVGTLGACFLL